MPRYTKADFEQELNDAIRDNVVTGAAIYAVNRHGQTLMHNAYGKSDVTPDAPAFTFDTTFWLASSTKLLTSISALQCVEKGLLSLDEPIGAIVPELANPDIVTGYSEERNEMITKKATKKITLRHLLTHSSGLGYDNGFNQLLIQYREVTGMGNPARNDRPLVDAHAKVLCFEPGEDWEYGIGIDYAGLMVERVTGKTLGEYFQENIFEPLGMRGIKFNAVHDPEIMNKLHGRVMRGEDKKMTSMPGSLFAPAHEAYDAGGSGLWGSSKEYLKVIKCLVTGGKELLNNNSMSMIKKGCLTDAARAGLKRKVKDRFWGPGIAVGLPREDDSIVFDHGLVSGVVASKIDGQCEAGMLHWGGLPNNNWYVDFERGVGGFWGTWLLPIADKPTGNLFGKFRRAMYEEAGRVSDSKL